MPTQSLLAWILVSVGMTLIETRSSLFEPVRGLAKKISEGFLGVLFSCPMCMGFWVGVLLCLASFPLPGLPADLHVAMKLLFSGAASSVVSYVGVLLCRKFEPTSLDKARQKGTLPAHQAVTDLLAATMTAEPEALSPTPEAPPDLSLILPEDDKTPPFSDQSESFESPRRA